MTCYFCGEDNPELSLFCRRCLALLDPFAATPEYVNENFDKIRNSAVQVYEQTIAVPEYREFLENFYLLVQRSLSELERGVSLAEEEMGEEKELLDEQVGEQVGMTRVGLQLYLEGLEILAAYRGGEDKTPILSGLEKLEEGNHLLNRAVMMIEEEGDSSVFLDQLT